VPIKGRQSFLIQINTLVFFELVLQSQRATTCRWSYDKLSHMGRWF
jgi:hypothetical protein